ncbi:hypothetical protein P154DRAFT_520237 [Amniculicola lignicola CBS 123094]|uniref:Box C/D snoRNA protein 1 n=1 Tax=Amniculicola lignicola CBS 123094 TaxID=1392246 RepID=A0A6A5WNJ1_9PLEO|nr:hypothetical protein P154DRAFT_520237 [Amniculicola lignicola CBS 123094]
MADDALLSDLCSICNTTTSKYRCPGCDARTCSLPCYKRHQQWAQCTGKRDPTKFIKKSQLATPAGIDHDFNFLASIERGVERADREVQERGLGASDDVRAGPRKGEVGDRQLQAAGVTVIRAPKGLTRQKQNKTHRSSKKGNIVWTVEWIHGNREHLLSEISEVVPIEEAYCSAIGQPIQKSGKKRKRDISDQDAPSLQDQIRREGVEKPHQESKLSTPGRTPGSESQPSAADLSRGSGPDAGADAQMASAVRPRHDGDEPEPESVSPEYHFFLLRPRTSSTRHVLIPIDRSSTLQQSLHGRAVLEFPTLYVFPSASAGTLPDDVVLEADYLNQETGEQKGLEQIISKATTLQKGGNNDADNKFDGSEEVDSQRLIEVLKRDLGGVA